MPAFAAVPTFAAVPNTMQTLRSVKVHAPADADEGVVAQVTVHHADVFAVYCQGYGGLFAVYALNSRRLRAVPLLRVRGQPLSMLARLRLRLPTALRPLPCAKHLAGFGVKVSSSAPAG